MTLGIDPVATKRAAGRPHGAKAGVLAKHEALRHFHFSYLRFAIEGFELRDAWLHCLAFAGGVNDERYFARRLREIAAQIRAAAEARGLGHMATTALSGLRGRRRRVTAPGILAVAGAPAASALVDLPTLEEWVQQRCAEQGIDADFQREADWLAEYKEAFALDVPAHGAGAAPSWIERVPSDADADDDVSPVDGAALRERLAALNALATELAVPPTLDDDLTLWLEAALCARLREVGVVSLANLADYIDLYQYRWHVRVRRLGAVRAGRLVAWLAPLVDQLGRPLRSTSLRPSARLALEREQRTALLDPITLQRFGIVPLDRVAVPPELSGRQGTFRVAGPNVLGVDDDLSALRAWLQRYVQSPRTYRAYFRAVEVFYLWCLWERRVALSSVVEADLHAFREFIGDPGADWVQLRPVDRNNDAWRPFRGALGPRSQRHLFAVIGAMYSGLVKAGYLSVHAATGVMPHLALARPTINVRRSFTDLQWSWVLQTLADLPVTPYTRRMRLVLELGATTGLRLIELCTARLGDLRQEFDEGGGAVWLLHLVGKGRRERDVLVHEDIKLLLDRHQVDMADAAVGFDPRAPLRTLTPALTNAERPSPLPTDSALEPEVDPAKRPLIGALRRPPPRWVLGVNGAAYLDRARAHGDAYGALDPSALYQALKRLFARAAKRAPVADPPIDGAALTKASPHWLRHFFANTAVADQVELPVLRDALGHESLQTTSIYVRPEQRALIREMAKMRRRA